MALDWRQLGVLKRNLSAEFRERAHVSTIGTNVAPLAGHLDRPLRDVIRHQVETEKYWFQAIELWPGYTTPGWSKPATEKAPYFGLPSDLTGKRVLDIGCAEGYFSFEAEKRGAREVIGIDSFPDSVRRFNIVRNAYQSNATAFLMNVYDLSPEKLGTFDVVLFYGVFYHLRHPQMALDRIRSVCTGDMIFQTVIYEEPAIKETPWAKYNPHGTMSGSDRSSYDPTNFWFYNSAACLAMLEVVGFVDSKVISTDPHPFVITTSVPDRSPGCPPDQMNAPWS